MTKKFVVVGHPRSGSTFLIERLALAVDAETPQVNHEELFNVYEKLFNARVLRLSGSDEVGMLEGFFASCSKPFAGFKTMPSFHREWQQLTALSDIQYITIVRTDLLGCIASMLVSERTWNWRQPARKQLRSGKAIFSEWFDDRRQLEMFIGELLNRLLFDLRELERLNAKANTIALTCEEMIGTLQSSELDHFFGREVVLQGFNPPTDYRECFEDADLFRETIVTFLRSSVQYDTFIPSVLRTLML